MKTNTTHSREDIYPAIERWQQSGLSQHEFCQVEGFSYSRFNYWVRKYRKENDGSSLNNFIPIHLASLNKASRSDNDVIRITYPNGVKVECSVNIERVHLQALIKL